MASRQFTQRYLIDEVIKHTDLFVAPSKAVKIFLQSAFKIGEDKVRELSYYIPNNPEPMAKEEQTKNELFTVGGAGTTDWRKGADLFLSLAYSVAKKYPEAKVKFVWKGAVGSLDLDRLQYDIKKASLQEFVFFESASDQMSAFYSSLDVFALTSREDPYPLVVLEAANQKVPTICFADTGGAVEFVEKSEGWTPVSYRDTDAMADAIIALYKDRQKLKQLGERAKMQLQRTHQDPYYIVHQFESILSEFEHA
jgi:glycosyltransferase involved in cell wall biosynthesis